MLTAEPHFPILFPIVVQSERFISFRKLNRHRHHTPKILLSVIPQTSRIIPQTFVCLFSMSVMDCLDDDEAIGHRRIIIARWLSSWHHCHCVFELLLSSSFPCCQPLLLDFGRRCLFVLLFSSSHRRHKMVIVIRWSSSWR